MQQFKINYFETENPGKQFPPTLSLSMVESAELLTELASRFRVENKPQEIGRFFSTLSHAIDDINAESEQFGVGRLLQRLGVAPEEQIFLLWLNESHAIDQMAYAGFVENFDYIWYPSSDDLVVFDHTLTCFLLVTHEGDVRFIRNQ